MRPRYFLLAAIFIAAHSSASASLGAITTNRVWDVLPAPSEPKQYREIMEIAGTKLGTWRLDVFGANIDGPRLIELARTAPDEPFVRVVREALQRPVDVEDFLLFLDDVLLAGQAGLRDEQVWVTNHRARQAGILLHPDDIFFGKPRRYGVATKRIAIDRPSRPQQYPPAKDGEILGPRWTARYRNPRGESGRLEALGAIAPSPTFAQRTRQLLEQLRAQGVSGARLTSTVRSRERGYLMWGAFMLSRTSSAAEVRRATALLVKLNREWGLDIPIRWRHPRGWRATIEAARQMADTYNVVYATRTGARQSFHYDGLAFDMVAYNLPRKLTLEAPDGTKRSFDLSDPEESRDLSLTPQLIDWIEEHFELEKLRSDYPHWNDNSAEARAFRRKRALGEKD